MMMMAMMMMMMMMMMIKCGIILFRFANITIIEFINNSFLDKSDQTHISISLTAHTLIYLLDFYTY
jgi:hypothetical protein